MNDIKSLWRTCLWGPTPSQTVAWHQIRTFQQNPGQIFSYSHYIENLCGSMIFPWFHMTSPIFFNCCRWCNPKLLTKPGLICTNTSGLNIDDIAAVLKDPSRDSWRHFLRQSSDFCKMFSTNSCLCLQSKTCFWIDDGRFVLVTLYCFFILSWLHDKNLRIWWLFFFFFFRKITRSWEPISSLQPMSCSSWRTFAPAAWANSEVVSVRKIHRAWVILFIYLFLKNLGVENPWSKTILNDPQTGDVHIVII